MNVTVDFGQIHPLPLLKSRVGFASNLTALNDGLADTVPWLRELGAVSFSGLCAFDDYLRFGDDRPNPIMQITSTDGTGRPLTASAVPAAVGPAFAARLNTASIRCAIQPVGAWPEYWQAYCPYGAAHPTPTNVAASSAKTRTFISATYWPTPVDWLLWNEFGHTLNGIKLGFNDDGTPRAETADEYATRRRLKRAEAVSVMGQLYSGTFAASGASLGDYATVSAGPTVAGDRKTSNGRDLPDGRTAHAAWWDTYGALSGVLPNTYAVANDFGNRGAIFLGDVADFDGADYPFLFTQGGPYTLKLTDEDGVDDNLEPASDTRMGPACEMMTMLLGDAGQPAIALRHFSYWLGGRDGFLSSDGAGGFYVRHRYTAMRLWMRLPTRRVRLSGDITTEPVLSGTGYALQGLIGTAGIDPGEQGAAVLLWNETDAPMDVSLSALSLPENLRDLTPWHYWLDEDHAEGEVEQWAGGTLTLAPRTIHMLEWRSAVSPERRREPLAASERNPQFLRRWDPYRRPKNACGYFDQVRCTGWLMPSVTSAPAVNTSAAWANMPDTVYLTVFTYAVDTPGAQFEVLADYGSGDVTLVNTTVGALAAGQVIPVALAASAPGGWAAGPRTVKLTVQTAGSTDQRVEFWLSGTELAARQIADESISERFAMTSRVPLSLLDNFNVMAHGAFGDGETDDTAAFLAAVDAASADQEILVPAGTYILSQSLVLGALASKGARLVGLGRPTLKFTGLGSTTDCVVLPGADYRQSLLRNLIIDCNGVGRDGLVLNAGSWPIFDNVQVKNAVRDAFVISCSDYGWVENGDFALRIDNAGRHAVRMELAGSLGSYINEILWRHLEIRGVSARENGGRAIYMTSTATGPGSKFSDHVLLKSNFDAIYASGATYTPSVNVVEIASGTAENWKVIQPAWENTGTGSLSGGYGFAVSGTGAWGGLNVDSSLLNSGWGNLGIHASVVGYVWHDYSGAKLQTNLPVVGKGGVAGSVVFNGVTIGQVGGENTITVGAGQTFTFTPASAKLFTVTNTATGAAVLCFGDFLTAAISLVANPSGTGVFANTSTPGAGVVGIFKSAGGHAISVKNGGASSVTLSVSVLGVSVAGATAPA